MVEIVEENGKKYIICPHCGAKVEKLVMYGKGPNPFCPRCFKLVSKKGIPEEMIERKPYKHPKKKATAQQTTPPKAPAPAPPPASTTTTIRREQEHGLFKKIREPHEILEEVLRTFNVKEDFIKFIVNKSRRTGGIHPADLIRYLLVMKSGVSNKDLANIIANEYTQAMIAEREKAKELGLNVFYPVYPPFGSGETTIYPPTATYPAQNPAQQLMQRYPTSQYHAPQQAFNPERLKQEILSTIQRILVEKEEKKKIDLLEEQLQKTREDMIKIQHTFESALKDVVSTLSDKLKDIVEKVKEPPPNVVTVDQLEKMNLQQQAKLHEELIKTKDERIKELVQTLKEERTEMTKSIQEILKQYEEERAELLKKLEEVRSQQPISTEGFRTDEARVLATAIDRATNIIAGRKPIEVIVKAMQPLFAPIPTEKPQYIETKESKSKVIDLLEGTEYVAEE